MSTQDFIDSLPNSDIKYTKDDIEKMYKDFMKNNKGGKRKQKKEKDPNAPKKPVNNYMNWCNAHRAEFKNKHPDAKPTELTALLGAEWRKLSDEEKAKWKSSSEVITTVAVSSVSVSLKNKEEEPVKEPSKSRKSKK